MTGQHTGRTDIPLLEAGRDHAKAAGRRLKAWEFTHVLTSPLMRAADTCALAGYQGEPEPDLMEWDYGEYEGLTTNAIRVDRPGWDIWQDGVRGGESVADVGRRADRVIERARQTDGVTLCVAHGHLLRILTARWVGLPPVGGRMFALSPGAVSVLGWERDTPVVEGWNLAD